MTLDPVLERLIVLAAEKAVRGRKQFTTAEDARQDMRVHLLEDPALGEGPPGQVFTRLRWIGVEHAKRMQEQCEQVIRGYATADRWGPLDGLTGEQVVDVIVSNGFRPSAGDAAFIAQCVDAHMDWNVVGEARGITPKGAYRMFKRTTSRVAGTRLGRGKEGTNE